MDTVHNAIAWYQKKIGSYDKQLWEESVEKKLLKVPPNVKNAPKKSVRLKTEYIDVDLIQGSTFTKTKPQVPWIYITRKALARVIFFPFYYKWWVLQTSLKLYLLLLVLYFLQLISIIVYLRNLDHSIVEDELSFTEVTLPVILMYLLCLVHSQTVLAHIGHKPPKRTKPMPRVIPQPKNKKTARKGHRSSGNNSSACQDDSVNLDSSKSTKREVSSTTNSLDNSQAANKRKVSKDETFLFPDVSEKTKSNKTEGFNSNKERLRRKVERNIQDRISQSASSKKSENGGSKIDRVTSEGFDVASNSAEGKREESLKKRCASNKDAIKRNGASSCSLEDMMDTLESVDKRKGSFENCDNTTKKIITSSCGHLDTYKDNMSLLEKESEVDDLKKSDDDFNDIRHPQHHQHCPHHHSVEAVCSSLSSPHANSQIVDDSGIQSNLSSDSSCSCHPSHHQHTFSDPLSANTVVANTLSDPDTLSEIPKISTSSFVHNSDGSDLTTPSRTSGKTSKESEDLTSPTNHDSQRNDVTKCSNLSPSSTGYSSSSCQPKVVKSNDPVCHHSCQNSVDCQRHVDTHHNQVNPSANESSASGLGSTEPLNEIQCFSELFVQEILNADTLREMSSTVLLANSDLENSSSSFTGQLSSASFSSSSSSSHAVSHAITESLNEAKDKSPSKNISSETCEPVSATDTNVAPPTLTSTTAATCTTPTSNTSFHNLPKRRQFTGRLPIQQEGGKDSPNAVVNTSLDESMEIMVPSDAERTSDVSNYSPSESEPDSDAAGLEDLRNRCEEKRKRLRFQEMNNNPVSNGSLSPHMSASVSYKLESTSSKGNAGTNGANVSRSVVNALTRKPSPLKDLSLSRKSNGTAQASTHSSASDVGKSESNRSCLRRRRRTSGNMGETDATRSRSVPNSHVTPLPEKNKMISSSENEVGEGYTGEGANKAAMSSEEWEDRIPLDESTSSNYSSSCGNSESETNNREGEDMEEEEKTEYTTSTLHVINLLQPQSGSPSSSGNVAQPDKVSCLIWEMNECKKVDLTALDIGWAIIDKVDSLPESSDYFLIGFLFSILMGLVPLAFRAFVNKNWTSLEDLLSWSGLVNKIMQTPDWVMEYTWRQNLLMVNGILQRFFLSLLFFFLLSVADRTFKQRLLYAKHFSYLTSSRRARKFSMPHFRLNKVRNIKIWLSLRSYLKRRGPQRSVDVIVSASFMCGISTVCLISLQMLKDSGNYLDFLCNWELLVWCLALAVFLLRFMTLGLKINKKYRNLSVLITEQINLYLQMEQKPHKKEELVLANNVLRLAEDLLKELESPFKISGFSANPFIYNITKVIVLSAFSAVLTELLGFKLKLHKIKLKG